MINLQGFTPLNIFLGWLSILSITLFSYSIFTLKQTQKKIRDIKDWEEKRWQELEDLGKKDYQQIIETANRKAQEIILQATQIRDETSITLQNSADALFENQNEALKEISKALSKKHEEQVRAINDENIKILISVYKDIETQTKSGFDEYKKRLEQQTFEAERIAQERIKGEYEKLETEIQTRKTKMVQDLDEKMYKIIQKVSKDVIGRSLDLSDQESLVIEALDRAKKEGVV